MNLSDIRYTHTHTHCCTSSPGEIEKYMQYMYKRPWFLLVQCTIIPSKSIFQHDRTTFTDTVGEKYTRQLLKNQKSLPGLPPPLCTSFNHSTVNFKQQYREGPLSKPPEFLFHFFLSFPSHLSALIHFNYVSSHFS